MGRKSKITQLPNELRATLDKLLRDGRFTQRQITDHLNKLLAEGGGQPISKSAIGRYAQRMEQAGQKIRQAREVAEVWIGRLGEEPKGDVGRLLVELLRTMAFDAASTAMDNEDTPASPELIGMLSTAIRDLERAAALSTARELAIRKETAKDAVKAATSVAKQRGLSAEAVAEIRDKILGVVK